MHCDEMAVLINFFACSLHVVLYIVSEHAERYGYGVVERFVGHGVGTVFHSEPIILHHRKFLILNLAFCTPCYFSWFDNSWNNL